MDYSEKLIEDIKLAEGLKLIAYKDSLGIWTIGYGHELDQTKDWTGYTISEQEALSLLQDDIKTAREYSTKLPEWAYLDTPCRQNAVIELVFNMFFKWRKFAKARYCIQHREWLGAHDELLNSLWAKEVGPRRSNRLANYLLTGQYPQQQET